MPKINTKYMFELAKNQGLNKGRVVFNELSSHELKMSDMLLELAKKSNGEYRFNKAEKESVVSALKVYKTEIVQSELMKTLLSVGKAENNGLTAKEMVNFMNVTNNLTKKEQMNVLEFLNHAKNVDAKEVLPTLHKVLPYEDFIRQEFGADINRNGIEDLLMDKYKTYEAAIHKSNVIEKSEIYKNATKVNNRKLADLIVSDRPDFQVIKAVSSCPNSKELVSIISLIGVNSTNLAAATSLTEIYKMGGTLNLIRDLSNSFYPHELKQIAQKIMESTSKNNILDYTNDSFHTKCALTTKRGAILKKLGLDGQIKLLSLDRAADVFKEGRVVTGNFEKGKLK